MNWNEKIISYHKALKTDLPLPKNVEWLYPYDNDETVRCMEEFYAKFYSDNESRVLLLGINPGRFGAGVTGVPFTDPQKLEEECGIQNAFNKRQELSSNFVYEFINAMGGAEAFYSNYYITSVCPLGFLKDEKNYNYYDSKELEEAVEPMILDNLRKQFEFGAREDVVYSMGKGKNYKYLLKFNKKYNLFERVVPLPHPRWVMQYRLKMKDIFIDEYVEQLTAALD